MYTQLFPLFFSFLSLILFSISCEAMPKWPIKEMDLLASLSRKALSHRKEKLAHFLNIRDLSDPSHGPHAVNLVVDKIKETFSSKLDNPSILFCRGGPISDVTEEFDALYIPSTDKQRSSRYTRYISEKQILRSHTTALIPRFLKKIRSENINDVYAFCPGMCYRRTVINKMYTSEPHKLDIWRIKRGNLLEERHLEDLIEIVLEGIGIGLEYRTQRTSHPYTLKGLKIDLKLGADQWIRLMECGQALPQLLEDSGLDSKKYTGLALGLGLDRLVMAVKHLDDIRLLRSDIPSIKSQMTTLAPYEPTIDRYKTFTRNFTFTSLFDIEEEDLCELIREILGEDSRFVEKLQLLSPDNRFPIMNLPLSTKHYTKVNRYSFNLIFGSNEEKITSNQVDFLSAQITTALHNIQKIPLIN
ncbi:MAG: hypothetical protein JSS34_06530 [Proteobacteria bacterium]|nr:hypothetical protein [Pseudomonadota bacterium]